MLLNAHLLHPLLASTTSISLIRTANRDISSNIGAEHYWKYLITTNSDTSTADVKLLTEDFQMKSQEQTLAPCRTASQMQQSGWASPIHCMFFALVGRICPWYSLWSDGAGCAPQQMSEMLQDYVRHQATFKLSCDEAHWAHPQPKLWLKPSHIEMRSETLHLCEALQMSPVYHESDTLALCCRLVVVLQCLTKVDTVMQDEFPQWHSKEEIEHQYQCSCTLDHGLDFCLMNFLDGLFPQFTEHRVITQDALNSLSANRPSGQTENPDDWAVTPILTKVVGR